MSVQRSGAYRRAVRWVLAWCAFYTRGIDADLAALRRDELASDLFEQAAWGDDQGLGPRHVSATIVSRALRGAAADLLWRRGALRSMADLDGAGWARHRRREGLATAVVLVLAAALVSWGVYVVARATAAAATGDIRWGSDTYLALCAFSAMAACGLVLLMRRRTRWLGALWMAAPSAALIHLGLFQLFTVSATIGVLLNSMPAWGLANGLATAGLLTLFIAAAVWWWPGRDDAQRAGAIG